MNAPRDEIFMQAPGPFSWEATTPVAASASIDLNAGPQQQQQWIHALEQQQKQCSDALRQWIEQCAHVGEGSL